MSNNADSRLIGLFVLGGLALAAGLVLMFGNGNYFSKVQRYVVYFEGSVNGLNPGAAVRLKGVSIGRVNEVLVQYDLANNRVLTPVIAEINLDKVMETRDISSSAHEHPTLQDLINRGLRARLSMQSLVTNQLYVDIDFQPDQPGHLVGQQSLGLPEIPTVVSSKDEIEKTIQKITREVRDLPLKETAEATLGVIHRIDHLLSKPETDASIVNLNKTLLSLQSLLNHFDGKVDSVTGNLDATTKNIQQLVRHLDTSVGVLTTAIEGMTKDGRLLVNNVNRELPPLLGSANASFKQANSTLSAIEELTEPDSDLSRALQDLSEAARSIRHLADTLERHPDNILYGRKKQENPR